MNICLRTYLLLAYLTASSNLIASAVTDSPTEDCGDVQHNVENGMIRLPEFSADNIKDLNCSWTYVAPPGRKLLVKVDSVHLPPTELRSSLFQLYIDNELYDIPRNCVKCLREMVGGKTIRVLFSSFVIPYTETPPNNSAVISTEGIGSFQVRYKSFDPHRCSKPEQIENGHIVSKGRKVGQSIFYRCNPPFDLFGESEVHCVVPTDSPVPDWSSKPPKCAVQDCTNGAISRESSSGSISSPGYPTYIHDFTAPCIWVVTAQLHQQIKVSITYLRFPEHHNHTFYENSSRLSLIDGDSTYLVNLTESLTNGSLNFTTLTNKLTVKFIVSDEDNKRKKETGFLLDYAAVSSSCPKPKAPLNGDVIAYSNDLGSVANYQCNNGFVLVGELHAECLLNGRWSHPAPTCEFLGEAPIFVAASNDSDTVTAKLEDLPVDVESVDSSSRVKPSRNGKKKLKDFHPMKATVNPPTVREKPTATASSETTSSSGTNKTSEARNGKKNDKENGPKSEPHLFQVIPPKQSGKKASNDATDRNTKPINASKADEQLPEPGDGLENDNAAKRHPLITVTMISIIAGVGAPLVVAIIFLIAIVIYRRRYPVRMRFGRKFSTFENPMYVTKDAQHPRELKRLTT